jgi:hypothetical protein
MFNEIKTKYNNHWKETDVKTQMEQFYYPLINTVKNWEPEKYYQEELDKNKDNSKNLV